MVPLPLITDATNLRGKRILVRTSLDVPIEEGIVVNDFRIHKALPTIQFLMNEGAQVILITHVGRDPQNTTAPIFHALQKYISLTHLEAILGDEVTEKINALENGEVLLLGNIRAYGEEDANDAVFGKTLASYADFYVNDAFAVSHRPHASIVGVPSHIPSFAGITFAEEYTHLSRALTPEHPALFIIGGAKFETKLPLIERYANSYEHVFVGGALANDLIKAKGYGIGKSLLSPIDLTGTPLIQKTNILTPIDVIVMGKRGKCVIDVGDVKEDEKILDVGHASIEMIAQHIRNAKTILWNGPLGYYEGGFDASTKTVAKLIAESSAFSIVGGGDTVAAIESLGLSEKFGFLSTAGGAMLEFLEKGTLPGIVALTQPQI